MEEELVQRPSSKPDSAIVISCDSLKSFFRYWIEFLSPIHNLSNKEMDILAFLLNKRNELSKVILDEVLLNRTLFSEETKRELREECGVSSSYFLILLCNLRKNKIVIDNTINPKFIPDLNTINQHKLMIIFNINE